MNSSCLQYAKERVFPRSFALKFKRNTFKPARNSYAIHAAEHLPYAGKWDFSSADESTWNICLREHIPEKIYVWTHNIPLFLLLSVQSVTS